MPSKSLAIWITAAARDLDEIESAHAAIGGTGPGRRYATQQINHAYAVLVSAQFQRFCRNLHAEAADALSARIAIPRLGDIVLAHFTTGRKLGHGNPNPGNIGADFDRLGMELWVEMDAHDPRNVSRRKQLQRLTDWRNAIAHQDFDPARLGGFTAIQLSDVRAWRRICNRLAHDLDIVAADHVATIVGQRPW